MTSTPSTPAIPSPRPASPLASRTASFANLASAYASRASLPLPSSLMNSLSTHAQANGQGTDTMDTRTPSPAPSNGSTRSINMRADGVTDGVPDGAAEAYKPDLSREVSLLSTKLVNAINYQTNLDDALQATRVQLEQAQTALSLVRAEKKGLDDAIARGVWVQKTAMDAAIAVEREKRENAEREKRRMDGEVESLTSSLFEEANKMVADARKEKQSVEKRNAQLRGRLEDTETLLASQQEQLQGLKLTMEALSSSSANVSTGGNRDLSAPSTPVNRHAATFESHAQQQSPGGEALGAIGDAAGTEPNPPLHFSSLLQPILRTDVAAYADFAELLASARRTAPHSRTASGTNMAPNTSTSGSQTQSQNQQTQQPLSSLSATTIERTSSPHLPGAFNSTALSEAFSTYTSSSNALNAPPPAPSLKESKFYKRILLEDLDPTLRLDLAPGLSFLSRRSVQSALLQGTLVVEPFTPTSTWKLYAPVFPCALCGEARTKDERYARRHRFRTSESDEAQRYPVCEFCVGRIRAAGDFLAFLRQVREGVWRVGHGAGGAGVGVGGGLEMGEVEGSGRAWEEAVRLRERCFWARIGGGVVVRSGFSVSGSGVQGRRMGSAEGDVFGPVVGRKEGARNLSSEAKGVVPGDGGDPGDLRTGTLEMGAASMLSSDSTAPETPVEEETESSPQDLETTTSSSFASTSSQQNQQAASAQLLQESSATVFMDTPPQIALDPDGEHKVELEETHDLPIPADLASSANPETPTLASISYLDAEAEAETPPPPPPPHLTPLPSLAQSHSESQIASSDGESASRVNGEDSTTSSRPSTSGGLSANAGAVASSVLARVKAMELRGK